MIYKEIKMRIIIRYILALVLCFFSHNLLAYTGHCNLISGDGTIGDDFGTKILTDTNNVAGNSIDPFYSWSSAKSYSLLCDCDSANVKTGIWAFSAKSSLPYTMDGWLQLNDYMDIKVRLKIKSGLSDVPFNDLSTGAENKNFVCTTGLAISGSTASGNSGNFAIRLKKPIIGTITIAPTVIAELWECYNTPASSTCPTSGSSVLKYYLSGTISAPETCTIGTGSISINLGSYYTGGFRVKGQPPIGTSKQEFTASIACSSGIETTANLKLSLSATPDSDYPLAIKSNVSGVGVIVTDSQGNIINPANGAISFTLNNSKQDIKFYSAPVSTTGIAPTTTGQFQSTGFLRVDYD